MQLKTSFFNKTLFCKNLSRFWPLWGMASFVGSLFPLALLMQVLRRENGTLFDSPLELTQLYYTAAVYAVPIISLLYAVLCAMLVWNYLYNARSVGAMHTLPIRREGLFFTTYLSGLAMMLIPYAFVGALCVLISLITRAFSLTALLTTVGIVLADSFFYFSSATLAAFITGNLFALPALYFLLHFLAVLLDWVISVFAGGFIYGLETSYSGAAEWLSPTVYLCSRIDVNVAYKTTADMISYTSIPASVSISRLSIVGIYALVGAVLLGIAWLLYRSRRSESAGDVIAVGWLKPVFRYGAAGLSALLFGLLLYELFWQQFQSGTLFDTVPMLVCMAVAGAIGYYAASMLLEKSLKVFRRSWLGLGAVVAVCAALCLALHLDVFGVAAKVPASGTFTQISLYTANNSYTLRAGEDDALIEQVRAVHQAIVEDRDYILRTVDDMEYAAPLGEDTEETAWGQFCLTYFLSNGRTVERRYYSLPLTESRMKQEGTYDALLDALVNDKAMMQKRLRAGDPRYTVDGGTFSLYASDSSFDLNAQEAAAILAAVRQDMQNGTWGHYDWFDSDEGDEYAMYLELSFRYEDTDQSGNPYSSSDWLSVRVRLGMTNTIDCLQELGLVTESQLVTNRQLDPEYYEDESAGTYHDPGVSGAGELGTFAVTAEGTEVG